MNAGLEVRRPPVREWLFDRGSGAAAAVAASVLGLAVIFVVRESVPAFRSLGVATWATSGSWTPSAGEYNLLPMVAGTLLSSAGALLLAAPVALGCAVFAELPGPRWPRVLVRRLVEVLAGVPSVVYGLWGLVSIVPLIARWEPPGASLLAGALVLALMILPTLALLFGNALDQVPEGYRRGAAALGLGRWSTLWGVCLPAAWGGLLAAVVLAAARALGETMAVLMVCGNVVAVPTSVFDPVRTLTANIALEMAYAMELHRSALFVSGTVLLVVVAGLAAAATRWGGPRG